MRAEWRRARSSNRDDDSVKSVQKRKIKKAHRGGGDSLKAATADEGPEHVDVDDHADHRAEGKQQPEKFAERASVWIQAGILVVTGIYVGLTYRLWQAALDANRSTQEAFERSQRAWILPYSQPADPLHELDPLAPPRIAVRLKNFGSHPALNVRTSFFTMLTNLPIADHIAERDRRVAARQSQTIMAPGTAIEIGTHFPPMIGMEVDEYNAGRAAFYVLGSVAYDDGFGRVRHSYICEYTTAKMALWEDCLNNNRAE